MSKHASGKASPATPETFPVSGPLAALARLAAALRAEGRSEDAVLLLDHLSRLEADNGPLLEMLVNTLFEAGRIAAALAACVRLRHYAADPADIVHRFTPLLNAAFGECQQCYSNADAAGAIAYLTPLAEILPSHQGVLTMALSCNQVLERHDEAALYARRLLDLQPDHVDAQMEIIAHLRRTGERASEIDYRLALMQASPGIEPVNHASNIYELVNLMMCQNLTDSLIAKIDLAQRLLAAMPITHDPDSEACAWIRFYQAMIGGIDLSRLRDAPPPPAVTLPELAGAAGQPISLADVQSLAAQYQAEAVFLVAGDESYVARYGRLFVRSVLHNADVPCLILVHVIGGAGRLAEIAGLVAVADGRVIYSGDHFDATLVTSTVLDAPTQPAITKPTAHYQSARFHQAGWILYALRLPLFVTDIDCLLERGVRDLLTPPERPDFMLNENHVVYQFGARITANLLLLFPTPHAQRFIRFVSGYLAVALLRHDIAKFIDQIALAMGQHYMKINFPDVKVGYFDVATDVNNCMLVTYLDHPFRFLSLYQQFDLASLPAFYREA
jgi:tetratricopeptide (TPR) repeat protein